MMSETYRLAQARRDGLRRMRRLTADEYLRRALHARRHYSRIASDRWIARARRVLEDEGGSAA